MGYNEVLFWQQSPGEAWLYSNRVGPPGASLCYWRRTWKARPFPDLPKNPDGTGEDVAWLRGVKCVSCSSLADGIILKDGITSVNAMGASCEPRLICTIHGGNTMHYGDLSKAPNNWRRVAEWDARVRATVEAA